jgi:hypothetical protein
VWSKYDQDATGFINIDFFPSFMLELGEPLGWNEGYQGKPEK